MGVSFQAVREYKIIECWSAVSGWCRVTPKRTATPFALPYINKHLCDLEFRSHMLRRALIDRIKASNDVPTKLAVSITGQSSGGSDFYT